MERDWQGQKMAGFKNQFSNLLHQTHFLLSLLEIWKKRVRNFHGDLAEKRRQTKWKLMCCRKMKSRRINEKMLLGLSWMERWDSDMGEQLHQPMCMFLIPAFSEGKVDMFPFDIGNKVTSWLRRAPWSVALFRFQVSSGTSFRLAWHLNLPFA